MISTVKNEDGVTIVELLATLTIVSLLASLAFASFHIYKDRAYIATSDTMIRQAITEIDVYIGNPDEDPVDGLHLLANIENTTGSIVYTGVGEEVFPALSVPLNIRVYASLWDCPAQYGAKVGHWVLVSHKTASRRSYFISQCSGNRTYWLGPSKQPGNF